MARRMKGRKRAISALRNEAGVSITSELQIFESRYQDLGSSRFDEGWKQEVESRVRD